VISGISFFSSSARQLAPGTRWMVVRMPIRDRFSASASAIGSLIVARPRS
jgi:hypothetical protein